MPSRQRRDGGLTYTPKARLKDQSQPCRG